MTETVRIAIIGYPQSMQSAIFGLQEMLGLANGICKENALATRFDVSVLGPEQAATDKSAYQAVIVPPSIEGSYYLHPSKALLQWLQGQHQKGGLICSACAGAFILAAAGLLKQRTATTHWALAEAFAQHFPDIRLNIEQILIEDNDIITAGGLMSWLDLGLELVSHYSNALIMRQLGKQLLIDTAPREQRYYQSFKPKFDHGDEAIRQVQNVMQNDSHLPLTVKELADQHHLTERTLLRRFHKATGYQPKAYLQRLRVQRACDLLESTALSINEIAHSVGYEDVSAFRKVFVKINGLTPKAFRKRFA